MKVENFSSVVEAQAAAVVALTSALTSAQQANTPVLLLLSGGSNLAVAAGLDPSLLTNTTIYPLDERWSTDPQVNNSRQLQAAGLPVEILEPQLNETVAAMGLRFNQLLHDWRVQYSEGQMIATLGMGADGHTAGISPLPDDPTIFKELFTEDTIWAVGYEGLLVPPERVTVTFPFLNQISQLIALITGAAKQPVLAAALAEQQQPHQLPMTALAHHPGLRIFTD